MTVKDVAKASRVSPATVTRVLHDHPLVRPETRRRVQQAISALGYIPNSIAQALVTQSTRTVGVLVPSSGDSFWGEVIAAIESRASADGFSVLLANGHGDPAREQRAIDLFVSRRVEGIIVTSTRSDPASWFGGNVPPLPLIRINWDLPLDRIFLAKARRLTISQLQRWAYRQMASNLYRVIAFDDLGAALSLTEHLLSLGHTRVSFVGLAPRLPAILRYTGCRMALERAGLELETVGVCEATLDAARLATVALVARKPPSAVVAFDDLTAIGVMHGLREIGLKVPGDVSVVGFDDIEVAAYVEPSLTTMRQPKEDLGALAMRAVLEPAMIGEAERQLPGRLVVRMSSAPPPNLSVPRTGSAVLER